LHASLPSVLDSECLDWRRTSRQHRPRSRTPQHVCGIRTAAAPEPIHFKGLGKSILTWGTELTRPFISELEDFPETRLYSAGRKAGGESGIRTHGRVSPTHAFQACSFNHSDISPCLENQRFTGERRSPKPNCDRNCDTPPNVLDHLRARDRLTVPEPYCTARRSVLGTLQYKPAPQRHHCSGDDSLPQPLRMSPPPKPRGKVG
jgi:hypothetical protein